MEEQEIEMMPEKIFFWENYFVIAVSETQKHRIPYRDIVWACIRSRKEEPGGRREPELAEITEETEGELVFYGRRHLKWIVQTDKMGQEAGALLKELCIHAPYIAAGGQDWFDPSRETDFGVVEEMVNVMRECGGY